MVHESISFSKLLYDDQPQSRAFDSLMATTMDSESFFSP